MSTTSRLGLTVCAGRVWRCARTSPSAPGVNRCRSPTPTAIRSSCTKRRPDGLADLQPAGTRCGDRYIRACGRQGQLLADDDRFCGAAEPLQALVVSVQAPYVARVLARSAQGGIEPEVGGVHLGGLLDTTLLQQQRAVGVPGRLHPAPRFVVGECVVAFDGAPQMWERYIELPFPVSDFTVQHFGCDRQDVACGVVEQVARFRDAVV